MTSPADRLPFPVLGDLNTIDFARPVQDVTAKLLELGAGMIEQPISAQPAIFIADTDLIDQVNDETHWEKHIGPSVRRLREIVGDGLFTAESGDPNWRKAHNILMPFFTRTAMNKYHDGMLATIADLFTGWDKKVRARTWISFPSELHRLTIEIIARVGMGHSLNRLDNPRERENPFTAMLLRELAYADRHVIDIPPDRKAQHESDRTGMRQQVAEIIESRRVQGSSTTDYDLLDALIHGVDPESGEQLSDDNVADQMLTMLSAGSESTANVMSIALHLLSINPDAIAKARKEIQQVWPTADGFEMGFEDVAKLGYLRRVVDETLRLWSVAPGYFRQARHDTTIGDGKYRFLQGEWVFVHLIAAHRMSAWGHDADQFNPDRFLADNVRQLPPRIYKPFGVGARACIGRRFATHEILLTLAAILRRYDLTAMPGYQLATSEAMTLKPINLQLQLSHRSRPPVTSVCQA